MIWCYDEAICEDLRRSINPSGGANTVVKVIDKEGILPLIAQIKEDEIQFPVVLLMRHPETPIDQARSNFTRLHKGVETVFDPESHNLYLERSIPIKLEYDVIVLGTNVVDVDEIVKELLFKYITTYFLTIETPYECKRKIRFGVAIDGNSDIKRSSGSYEYMSEGKLYEANISIRCEGAVLLSYVPKHLERTAFDDGVVIKTPGSEP